jgi:hypothetical protein
VPEACLLEAKSATSAVSGATSPATALKVVATAPVAMVVVVVATAVVQEDTVAALVRPPATPAVASVT